jgi:hypothetical protein
MFIDEFNLTPELAKKEKKRKDKERTRLYIWCGSRREKTIFYFLAS